LDNKPLGKGSFGIVWRASCGAINVAVKEPHRTNLTPKQKQELLKEMQVMSTVCRHPNIVLYLGACFEPSFGQKYRIVMELCDISLQDYLTDLGKTLRKEGKEKYLSLRVPERIELGKQAALGVYWLHDIAHLVHGDIKSANFMITLKDMKVKVCDFGFSELKVEPDEKIETTKPKGTPHNMAPEIMRGDSYDPRKADVFAFSVVLWEIYTCCDELYPGFTEYGPFAKAIQEGLRLKVPESCPIPYRLLMSRCWDEKADNRPDFREIVFRLEECIIEVQISNKSAKNWWKQNFLIPCYSNEKVEAYKGLHNAVTIDYSTFAKICSYNGVRGDFDQVRDVLSQKINNHNVLTPMLWDIVTQCFGEFYDPEKPQLMQRIVDLSKMEWFHGFISGQESEDRLRGHPNKTFLLRMREKKERRTILYFIYQC